MEKLQLGYHSISMPDLIAGATVYGQLLLPSVQRDVAWTDTTKISDLFDSIYKGYPINPILLLKMVKGQNDKLATLYRFNTNRDETGKLFDNQYFDFDMLLDGDERYLVLDGQQRITALYRGMRGNIAGQELYFNAACEIAVNEEDDVDENLRQEFFDKSVFAFRTNGIANVYQSEIWVRVRDWHNLNSDEEVDEYIDTIIKETSDYWENRYHNARRKTAYRREEYEQYNVWKSFAANHRIAVRNAIKKLQNIFFEKHETSGFLEYNLISFDGMSIDEQRKRLLSIFIRFNMGGVALTPADLLYSQLAASTKMDDVRSAFKETMGNINSRREPSYFELPHFMRLLWLVFGRSSFKSFFASQDVQKCQKKDIDDVKDALIKAKEAYIQAKFNFAKRISYNMFLPVAYYFYQIRNKKPTEEEQLTIQVELAKYYSVVSLTGYLSGQSDSTLRRLKRAMNFVDGSSVFENNVFCFKTLQDKVNAETSIRGKKLGIAETEIDKFLEYEYGENSAEISQLLTFLSKEDYSTTYLFPKEEDIDHMHPKKFALDEEKMQTEYPNFDLKTYDYYCKTYNKLPNLQILSATLNRGFKNDKPLKMWVEEKFGESGARDYLISQYICDCDDVKDIGWLAFENYEKFYNARRGIIKAKLIQMLGVDSE